MYRSLEADLAMRSRSLSIWAMNRPLQILYFENLGGHSTSKLFFCLFTPADVTFLGPEMLLCSHSMDNMKSSSMIYPVSHLGYQAA